MRKALKVPDVLTVVLAAGLVLGATFTEFLPMELDDIEQVLRETGIVQKAPSSEGTPRKF